MPIGSPMVIMSRFVKKEYGEDYKTIFVGPCFAKKIEAKQSGDVDDAITFAELQQILDYYKENNIPYKEFSYDITTSGDADFDKFYNDYTKVFPLTGGVADTLHYRDVLTPDQVLVVDELKNLDAAIHYMETNPNIKFLDPLACAGGCIGGPGMMSKAPIPERAQKVKDYKDYCKKDKMGRKEGKFEYSHGLDFSNKII
jgi:iron only hydrogenase large subunit-like protein